MQHFPQIWEAWQRRQALVQGEKLDAWRLIHGAADGMPGLYIDHYRGRFLITIQEGAWLEQRPVLESTLGEWQESLRPAFAPQFFWVSNLPRQRLALPFAEAQRFELSEDGARFEVHLGEGPHTGLFLDQRENRRELRKIASKRRCLNLFCHTGAFTVAALRGGASEVISVDLSKNYLSWLERNLDLNDLDTKLHLSIASDAFAYLKKACIKAESFDLILLDPPTFGRGKDGAFSTIRDYGRLLNHCLELLSPNGKMLACLNTKKIEAARFRDFLKEALRNRNKKLLKAGSQPKDFPTAGKEAFPLKAYWLG